MFFSAARALFPPESSGAGTSPPASGPSGVGTSPPTPGPWAYWGPINEFMAARDRAKAEEAAAAAEAEAAAETEAAEMEAAETEAAEKGPVPRPRATAREGVVGAEGRCVFFKPSLV